MDKQIISALTEGAIVLHKDGRIYLVNDRAMEILGLHKDFTGKTVSSLMEDAPGKRNAAFRQLFTEILANARKVCAEQAVFVRQDGSTVYINLTASSITDPVEGEMFFISFDDMTGEVLQRNKRRDAISVLLAFLVAVCVWCFAAAAWEFFGKPVSQVTVSNSLIGFACFISLIVWRRAGLSLRNIGIDIKGKGKYILWDAGAAVVLVLLLMAFKAVILKVYPSFFPEGTPFIDWKKYDLASYGAYLLSVFGQEVVSRGVVHESIKNILPVRHANFWAIVISSMIFGALHIHVGLVYMVSASLLLAVFGAVYAKQKSIWGLCIPHFILGEAIGLLNFVTY